MSRRSQSRTRSGTRSPSRQISQQMKNVMNDVVRDVKRLDNIDFEQINKELLQILKNSLRDVKIPRDALRRIMRDVKKITLAFNNSYIKEYDLSQKEEKELKNVIGREIDDLNSYIDSQFNVVTEIALLGIFNYKRSKMYRGIIILVYLLAWICFFCLFQYQYKAVGNLPECKIEETFEWNIFSQIFYGAKNTYQNQEEIVYNQISNIIERYLPSSDMDVFLVKYFSIKGSEFYANKRFCVARQKFYENAQYQVLIPIAYKILVCVILLLVQISYDFIKNISSEDYLEQELKRFNKNREKRERLDQKQEISKQEIERLKSLPRKTQTKISEAWMMALNQ